MATQSPVFCTFALLIAQLADAGSSSRDDRHRAQVHDAETQEDRHQTDIALGAMEAEAQAVSQGRAGVGRHFAATGAEVVFHDVRPLLLLSPRRLQVVAEIAAESWNSSCEFAIVHPPVGWRPREHASPG